MAQQVVEYFPKEKSQKSLNQSENSATKMLLHVLSLFLSEEYIQKAKENPDIFSKKRKLL